MAVLAWGSDRVTDCGGKMNCVTGDWTELVGEVIEATVEVKVAGLDTSAFGGVEDVAVCGPTTAAIELDVLKFVLGTV